MKLELREILEDAAAPAVAVGGLAMDSRRVRPGDAFLACRGATFDGHDFAGDAVGAGAVAVVSERALDVDVPNAVVPDLGDRLSALGGRFHGHPSRSLDVVGVTGTNGKTTVAYNVARLLGGGYLGTLGRGTPPRLCGAGPSSAPDLTTADPITVQAALAAFRDQGVRNVAVEASSHALHQGRVAAVDFAVGVFTNLSRDHLDYHGSMAAYADAKRRLFSPAPRCAVVNAEDAVGQSIIDALPTSTETFAVGRDAAVGWTDIEYGERGLRGCWRTPWGSGPFALPGYFGDFSVQNAAMALAVCCALDMPFAAAAEAMAGLDAVPGRMQRASADPAVVIDYAHTPDGLVAALGALRAHVRSGRAILVFGCGGDRDRGKRAAMAQAAEHGADLAVATSDNPRGEPPERILEDLRAGFAHPERAIFEADRRRAIARALAECGTGDVVLVAGKGHERYQEIGGRRLPFDDAAVVRELLDDRGRPEGGD